jgi:hypothetical protein
VPSGDVMAIEALLRVHVGMGYAAVPDMGRLMLTVFYLPLSMLGQPGLGVSIAE